MQTEINFSKSEVVKLTKSVSETLWAIGTSVVATEMVFINYNINPLSNEHYTDPQEMHLFHFYRLRLIKSQYQCYQNLVLQNS